MHAVCFDGSFAGWREAARTQLRRGMAPHQLSWVQDSQENHDLFGQLDEPQPTMAVDRPVRVPRTLIDQLESAARFRCPQRWALLYRILWRVANGDQAAMLAGDIAVSYTHLTLPTKA